MWHKPRHLRMRTYLRTYEYVRIKCDSGDKNMNKNAIRDKSKT